MNNETVLQQEQSSFPLQIIKTIIGAAMGLFLSLVILGLIAIII